ncbi:hypothetical protein VP01_275g6 [Puccinia sorghi]|uniref:Uncharacterized protein n=1 Tax=Puccinia sorghi TaxID=27349 RepID=A0A0L6V2Y6_9BASI|nr:hypothetical protein VP01_275g6 [Puccinia sorghi]
MDGINPYGNKQAGKHSSITFMIMVCYSFPLELRYKPQNLCVVGIAPGPSHHSNKSTGSSARFHPPILRRFSSLAPWPWICKLLGHLNVLPDTWPPQTLEDHKARAIESRDARTSKIQDEILKDYGFRYSVMVELPYWDIINYHVVDSMHNLLLGLLKWHCQRFWTMTDVDQEPEPKGTAQQEIKDLKRDAKKAFRSTESSNNSFSPHLDAEGWDTGPWTPPPEDKIILDGVALDFVNKLLPRIRMLTLIKRAPPVLGKSSFGSLKADEWRNLFTIQLPLILPVYWAAGGPTARFLSSKYREHCLEYLNSCLVLFPDVTLAPNHHMSIHLADCLEKFGPSRAWWSFAMERLMGSILKASHNNRLGLSFPHFYLEETFLTNYSRLGNLDALLSTPERFPAQLRPFLNQLQGFHNPPVSAEPRTPATAWSLFCAPQYGIIKEIFTHQRTLGDGTSVADTWLLIQPLQPCQFSSPFAGLAKFNLQVELRTIHGEMLYVNHTKDVLAHCAWIKYKASKILPSINKECLAIVSLDH